MSIKEINLNFWELLDFNQDNIFDFCDNNVPTLIWSSLSDFEIEAVDAYILNVLPPKHKLPWYFSLSAFRAAGIGKYTYYEKLDRKEVEKLYSNILIQTGCSRDSYLHNFFLRGLTGYFNKDGDTPLDWDFFILNTTLVESTLVSTASKEYVSCYLHDQLEQFSEKAFVDLDIDYIHIINSLSVRSNELYHKYERMFSKCVDYFDCNELINLKEEIKQNGTKPLLLPEDMLLADKKGVNIFFLDRHLHDGCMDLIYEILEMRIDWAIENLPLGILDSLKDIMLDGLTYKNWLKIEKSKIRNMILKKLNTRLAQFPIVEINPFFMD